MTFQEIATEWLAFKEQKVQAKSMETYRTALTTTIIPAIGELEEVTEEDVQAFKEHLTENGVKASSFRNYINIARNVLRFGAEKGWCHFPAWNTGLQGKDYKSERQAILLTPLQEQKLVQHLISTPTPRHLGIFMALSFGLRLGEACDMQWSAVDLEKGFLNVIEAPGQLRRIPIPQELVPVLTLCSYGKPKNSYICTGTTEPVAANKSIRDSLKAVSKKLDLPILIFQDLRHMFTVRCIRSGCDFITLMSLLGYNNAHNLYHDYKSFFHPDTATAMSAQAAVMLPQQEV